MDAGFDAAEAAEGQSVKHGNPVSRGSKPAAMGTSMGVCGRSAQVYRKVANLHLNPAIPQGAAVPPQEAKIAPDFSCLRAILRCGLDQYSEDRRPRWAGDLFQQIQIPQTIQM